ncbi:MAG: Ribosomal RNA small subunit methyltransferase B [Chlamydiae bacterium]|nr:Ribosomal RNA small subunit methyltransferase B [Chlamydiota bacterium]
MQYTFPEVHLFQVLRRFEHQHLPLDLFLRHYFQAHKALGSKDRQLIAEATYGMTRWSLLLDHVSEGVPSWEKRYTIFRNFQPENYLYVNTIPLHTRISFPQELFAHLVKQYGKEKAIHLCQICNTQASLTVRINPAKTTREALLEEWNEHPVSPTSHSPFGIQCKKRIPLTSFPTFKEGLFEIQDEASQLVALYVKAQPGDLVLDYCAGSGGKTLAFAHQMEGKGQIYLHDVRRGVLDQAKKRLKRAGIQNGQVIHDTHPHLATLRRKMDWVLVDAPCTGTGTLRRNPDQKWKFSNALLNRLVGEQRLIFEKALSYVKPKGAIVYATCSMLREENEDQLHRFLASYPLKLEGDPFVSLPSYEGMDGFFAATLRKVE